MAWVYAFWALGALAVVGIVVDLVALRRHAAGRLPVVSLALKALIVGGFVAWWVYFEVAGSATGWEDLQSFAALLLLSVVVFGVTLVLDVFATRALVRAASRRPA